MNYRQQRKMVVMCLLIAVVVPTGWAVLHHLMQGNPASALIMLGLGAFVTAALYSVSDTRRPM